MWNAAYAGPAAPLARCPYDFVASFLFRFSPPDRPRAETDVLELGFGGGANLWFAARQGFRVAGVEVSDVALEHARHLFEQDDLKGDLRRSGFVPLPFPDNSFDLAFDRAALSYANWDEAAAAIAEVHRVLRPGGRFLFNPYSKSDSSASDMSPESVDRTPWAAGATPFFYDRSDIERTLGAGWVLHELLHVSEIDECSRKSTCRATWRAVAEPRL